GGRRRLVLPGPGRAAARARPYHLIKGCLAPRGSPKVRAPPWPAPAHGRARVRSEAGMRTTPWISAGLIIVLAVACGDDASPGQGDGSETDSALGDGEVSEEVGPDGSDDTNTPE